MLYRVDMRFVGCDLFCFTTCIAVRKYVSTLDGSTNLYLSSFRSRCPLLVVYIEERKDVARSTVTVA